MSSPSCYVESLICSAKRLRISPASTTRIQRAHHRRCLQTSSSVERPSASSQASSRTPSTTRAASEVTAQGQNEGAQNLKSLRLPKAVQAVFLAPLKRTPTHGIPVCDLQIRSYSVRNLELFTDFCLRAAYYLKLAAKGPIPLPRITERWTVPRSNFIFKKSQENFERITMRRLIQIQDGHPDTVALWLAYIQKRRYYGVGMKANVFEYGGLEVAKDLDAETERVQKSLGEISATWLNSDWHPNAKLEDMTVTQPFKAQWGAYAPMAGTDRVSSGRKRFARRSITYFNDQANADLKLQYKDGKSSSTSTQASDGAKS